MAEFSAQVNRESRAKLEQLENGHSESEADTPPRRRTKKMDNFVKALKEEKIAKLKKAVGRPKSNDSSDKCAQTPKEYSISVHRLKEPFRINVIVLKFILVDFLDRLLRRKKRKHRNQLQFVAQLLLQVSVYLPGHVMF